jgi:hypothetical protein
VRAWLISVFAGRVLNGIGVAAAGTGPGGSSPVGPRARRSDDGAVASTSMMAPTCVVVDLATDGAHRAGVDRAAVTGSAFARMRLLHVDPLLPKFSYLASVLLIDALVD